MSSIFKSFFNKDRENRTPGKINYTNNKPDNKDTIKFKAQIFGLVQGVGFRYTTIHLAEEIGIRGFVRNENDGSVYVEAIGNSKQTEQFIDELAKGPSPSAQVEKVDITFDSSIKDHKGFSQRH